MRRGLAIAVALVAVLPGAPAVAGSEALRIGWEDLRPAGQSDGPAGLPGRAASAPNHGETLSATLDGREVEISGFLLPTDREGDLAYAFLLVPWTGACSHMPSPPPNQMVLVTPDRPYKVSAAYEPVSVSGRLRLGLERSQLFILDGVATLDSGYSIGRATVAPAPDLPDAEPSALPWPFLER